MADLIPAPEQSEETSPDYLGKEAARSFKAQPALPVGGPLIGGGGGGEGSTTAHAPRVTREPSSGLAIREDSTQRAIAMALQALQSGGTLRGVAERIAGGLPPETVPQSDIFSGEGGAGGAVDTFTRGSAPPPLPPGSSAEAAALGDLSAASHDEIASWASTLPADALRAAGGVGGVLSLVNAVQAMRQGRVPETIESALRAAGALARFAPQSWGLTAPFAAGGAGVGAGAGATGAGLVGESGAAAAAGETAGAGAAGAAGTAAGTLAGAAGAVALPFAVGKAIEFIINGIFGVGDQDLGEKLRYRGEHAADIAGKTIESALATAKTPGELLGIANATQGLGQGQVQFTHDTFGFGGDFDDPMSPTFKAALERAASDPQALKDFIRGVHIKLGPTGTPGDNWQLTDTFRRNLAHAAGLSEAETAGLFEPTPEAMTPEGMRRNLQEIVNNEGYDPAERAIAQEQLDKLARGEPAAMPINFGAPSPYYRTDFSAPSGGGAFPSGLAEVARAAMQEARAGEQVVPTQAAPGGGGSAAMLEALGLLNEGAP